MSEKYGLDDELLTTNEVRKYLGLAQGTLERWRTHERYPEKYGTKKKYMKYVRIGRQIKYRTSDVKEFLNGSEVK